MVAVPDVPATLAGLDETVETLHGWGVPFRIDPMLEPIGFGFAASLGRYLEVRRRYPDAEMLMGVGNLTELTDVDSAGVNVLLLGFCQELGIRSVLTTEVINWCRSCVPRAGPGAAAGLLRRARIACCPSIWSRPGAAARSEAAQHGEAMLARAGRRASRDRNYRLFAERGLLHVLNGRMHLARDRSVRAVRRDAAARGRSTRSTPFISATRWPRR